jgi:hypothetical protein
VTNKRAPNGLGPAGKQLWHEIVAAFTLRPDGQALLVQACKLSDEIHALELALLEAPPIITSYPAGSYKSNPLYSQVRDHRLALARLLQQLPATRVPVESEPGADDGVLLDLTARAQRRAGQ